MNKLLFKKSQEHNQRLKNVKMLFERLAKLDDLPNLPTEIAAVAVY
jgi:hypothetical protein